MIQINKKFMIKYSEVYKSLFDIFLYIHVATMTFTAHGSKDNIEQQCVAERSID